MDRPQLILVQQAVFSHIWLQLQSAIVTTEKQSTTTLYHERQHKKPCDTGGVLYVHMYLVALCALAKRINSLKLWIRIPGISRYNWVPYWKCQHTVPALERSSIKDGLPWKAALYTGVQPFRSHLLMYAPAWRSTWDVREKLNSFGSTETFKLLSWFRNYLNRDITVERCDLCGKFVHLKGKRNPHQQFLCSWVTLQWWGEYCHPWCLDWKGCTKGSWCWLHLTPCAAQLLGHWSSQHSETLWPAVAFHAEQACCCCYGGKTWNSPWRALRAGGITPQEPAICKKDTEWS